MTKKLVWRLKEQPSTESLRGLVHDGLLTKDEARQVLFTEHDDDGKDSIDPSEIVRLKEEVQFLRKLVDKLSDGRVNEVVKTIEIIKQPQWDYKWYRPYEIYCNALSTEGTYTASTNLASLNTGTTI